MRTDSPTAIRSYVDVAPCTDRTMVSPGHRLSAAAPDPPNRCEKAHCACFAICR